MQHSLSLVGLLSVAVVGLLATHPDYAHAVGRWIVPGADAPPPAPVAVAEPDPLTGSIAHQGGEAGRLLGLAPTPADAPAVPAVAATKVSTAPDRSVLGREKREATGYLARKYRVNSDAVAMLVDAAYTTGKDLGLDPLLLLAVMGVESGFNPFAESSAGASGLMQLMSKVHRDKLNDFGGANIALNPVVNLRVGAVVLKDCIKRGGSIVDGLRLYVGAGLGDDAGYGSRVLQEKDRLAQVVRGNGRPRIEPIPVVSGKGVVTTRAAHHDDETHGEAIEAPAEPRHPDIARDTEQGRVAAL